MPESKNSQTNFTHFEWVSFVVSERDLITSDDYLEAAADYERMALEDNLIDPYAALEVAYRFYEKAMELEVRVSESSSS